MQQTLDQRRAAHAARHASKDDASIASSLPGLIIANGLPMTAAYLAEKGHRKVLQDLESWLQECPLGLNMRSALLEYCLASDARAVRAATEEVLAWLAWYKRLANALKKG